jgi:hypothetical protein
MVGRIHTTPEFELLAGMKKEEKEIELKEPPS